MHALLHIPLIAVLAAPALAGDAQSAITTFNAWCFKAGQTQSDARSNMQAEGAPFALTFWDDSLAPRPADAPKGIERRCELVFDGDHTAAALEALHVQMAKPPVFGTPIPLPDTHRATADTTFIQGRELLRGRVAVVHIGTRTDAASTQTFMAVDRLYPGLGLPQERP